MFFVISQMKNKKKNLLNKLKMMKETKVISCSTILVIN